MEATVLLSFWALALLLVITPGPDWAFVLGHALRGRSIVLPLAGIGIGYLGLTAVVAAGLGAVVASHPAVLTVITVLGSLVLVRIGWSMLGAALRGPVTTPTTAEESKLETREPAGRAGGTVVATKPRVTTPPSARAAARPMAMLLQGAAVSGLNPKGLMLFVALLPQFVSPAGEWPVAGQIIALGLVFIASALGVYSLLGGFARTVLAGSDRASRVLSGVAGGAMLLVAAGMLGQQLLG